VFPAGPGISLRNPVLLLQSLRQVYRILDFCLEGAVVEAEGL
jgi:hypothetical protein